MRNEHDDLVLNYRLKNGKMKPHKLLHHSMKVRLIDYPGASTLRSYPKDSVKSHSTACKVDLL